MIEKVEGVVIGERSYSETSKILDVYTKDHGIIGVMSKGCKRMKSELRSVSAKLTYGYFHIFYKEGKLSNLMGVDVINPFKNIKNDIIKISYASFLLELSGGVEKAYQSEEIYNFLISGLCKIEEGFDPVVITNILELKYLEYLGIMPRIEGCSICGSKEDIATVSSMRGGYVCKNCLTNERKVSLKTIKLIRLFYYVDIDKISKLEIGNTEKREINDFLDEYYDSYAGLYLKSKSFLRNLGKI